MQNKQRHLYLRDNFDFFFVFQQVVNDLVEVDFLGVFKAMHQFKTCTMEMMGQIKETLSPVLNSPCRRASLGLCTPPALPAWWPTHRRIPGKIKGTTAPSRSFRWRSTKLGFGWNGFFSLPSTNLVLGHVQESHWVSLTLDVGPHCVQSFVKLPLNIRQLFKNLAGGPQQHLSQQKSALFAFFQRRFCT